MQKYSPRDKWIISDRGGIRLKEADRDDDSVRLEFLEPAKDDFDVLDVVPVGELEEESRGAD